MAKATVARDPRRFYVYVIFRPDGTPCYVGKGSASRWVVHARRAHNPHLRRIYELAVGELPIIKVREHLLHTEACELEIALISAIGREDRGCGPLVNFTDGGEGAFGRSQSDATKALIGMKALGRSITPEHKTKLLVANTGHHRRHSDETKEKIRQKAIGRKASEEARRRMSVARSGKKKAPEHVAKLVAKLIAWQQTPDAHEKMRLAAILRWQRRKANQAADVVDEWIPRHDTN